jgi:hypothetical protein
MRRFIVMALAGLVAIPSAWSFCGYYVAQADSKLFNQSSQVVLTRDGDRTVLTMANDYQGDLNNFAIVIPVPTQISRESVKVVEKTAIDHIDAYSAPRLTEYYDPDPCPEPSDYASYGRAKTAMPMAAMAVADEAMEREERSLGVRILDSYTVGEYDILILSAEDSSGLVTWLNRSGYQMSQNAAPILQSYIAQNMRFFVAKVNLGEKARSGAEFLRPLQVSYNSPKFMLPIRLGMLNSQNTQDLFVYTLSPKGRVETTNYRSIKIPSNVNVPEFVQQEFAPFYKDLFATQVAKDGMSGAYVEYGWPISVACDPCSADPITVSELNSLGVNWLTEQYGNYQQKGYLTRLHLRYDLAHFPEDLVFQETSDQSTFQGRYIIQHPFNGDTSCSAGRSYEKTLAQRQAQEVQTLSSLTGWSSSAIWKRVPKRANPVTPPAPTPSNFWTWE